MIYIVLNLFCFVKEFPEVKAEELIQHGVNALKETVRTKDIKLTTDNVSVMIVVSICSILVFVVNVQG